MGLQVILSEDVPNLGGIGDIVNVASGYARNYLIPRNFAVLATSGNRKQVEHTQRLLEKKRASALKSAEALASTLGDVSVTISKQVGEEDKLYGSVTNRDIEEALAKEGIRIDRRKIVLSEPIKTLGVYDVDVKLHSSLVSQIKVWVVAE